MKYLRINRPRFFDRRDGLLHGILVLQVLLEKKPYCGTNPRRQTGVLFRRRTPACRLPAGRQSPAALS